MRFIITLLTTLALWALPVSSFALSESEAEDLADITAVFIFLKKDCGFHDLPADQIRLALLALARENHWDLSNYNQFNINKMSNEGYLDLKGIGVSQKKKCVTLARGSLGLLASVQ